MEINDYEDIKIRVNELVILAKKGMKSSYIDLDDALEDAMLAVLDNKYKTIDILKRPF